MMQQFRLHRPLHMAESQLAPPDPACPLCGSNDRSPVYVIQQDPIVRFLKCASCGAVSASRIPTTDALEAYYAGYYGSNLFPSGSEQVTFDDARRFGKHLAKRVERYGRRSSIKILDFGGGDGTVALRTAEQLIESGLESVAITVVDPSATVVQAADPRISLSGQTTLDGLSASAYDLVIASAVIEHLPHPRAFLDSLLDLVDPGGIFYARTPYRVPFIKWFTRLGIEWATMYPAHIHDLGQDFWEAYFDRIVSSPSLKLLESRPSIVESSFRGHVLRTLIAYALKAPWYLLGKRYTLVGGWEVLVRKNSEPTASTARPSPAR
jgi:SAM-dependent methyltransferase